MINEFLKKHDVKSWHWRINYSFHIFSGSTQHSVYSNCPDSILHCCHCCERHKRKEGTCDVTFWIWQGILLEAVYWCHCLTQVLITSLTSQNVALGPGDFSIINLPHYDFQSSQLQQNLQNKWVPKSCLCTIFIASLTLGREALEIWK